MLGRFKFGEVEYQTINLSSSYEFKIQDVKENPEGTLWHSARDWRVSPPVLKCHEEAFLWGRRSATPWRSCFRVRPCENVVAIPRHKAHVCFLSVLETCLLLKQIFRAERNDCAARVCQNWTDVCLFKTVSGKGPLPLTTVAAAEGYARTWKCGLVPVSGARPSFAPFLSLPWLPC